MNFPLLTHRETSGLIRTLGGVPIRLALSKRFLGIPPSSFFLAFILNAAYHALVLDKDSQPEMGVSYAIRSCNEVCKDKTAALTVVYPSHRLIYCGVGIQGSPW